jgi:hypothetical protein
VHNIESIEIFQCKIFSQEGCSSTKECKDIESIEISQCKVFSQEGCSSTKECKDFQCTTLCQ